MLIGAGVSVSAGIPDFRSPQTGLYHNLAQYNLPYAEAIFDLDYFQSVDSRPFYRLCRELWPGQYTPTPTHRFIRLLHEKKLLRRCFTQNIDSLETAAGLPKEMVVAAHGNFDSAHVVGRDDVEVPIEEVRAAAMGEDDWASLNERYGGLCKPSIVFFGEQLPPRFFEAIRTDFPSCGLLLVMGTSLVVQPFASLIDQVRPGTPRALFNRERVGEGGVMSAGGFDFDGSSDTFVEGDCDAACLELVRLAGWEADFAALEDNCGA